MLILSFSQLYTWVRTVRVFSGLPEFAHRHIPLLIPSKLKCYIGNLQHSSIFIFVAGIQHIPGDTGTKMNRASNIRYSFLVPKWTGQAIFATPSWYPSDANYLHYDSARTALQWSVLQLSLTTILYSISIFINVTWFIRTSFGFVFDKIINNSWNDTFLDRWHLLYKGKA